MKTEGVLRGQLQLLIPAATPADSGVYALRIFVNEERHSAHCSLAVAGERIIFSFVFSSFCSS